MVIELSGVQFGLKSYAWYFKIERARSASSIWNHKCDFRPKLHDKKFNYHFIKSILKSHNFMALNFRFCCIVPSSRFVKNNGTGNALTSYLVCKTMWCDENSFKHNKQTSSSGERKRFTSCIKVRFSLPESMMVDFPFFCGWGWDFSLSLGKEFEVAARAFELWNSLDCTMSSCV